MINPLIQHSNDGAAAANAAQDSIEHCGSAAPVDVDIVIPVYNERAVLADSIRTLHDFLSGGVVRRTPYSWNIVIADNASSDDTWPIARQLCDTYPRTVRAVHIDRKGRGYALKQTWGESVARVMAYMDVDLSTDIRSIDALVGPLLSGAADVATGSRLTQRSQVTRSFKREVISRVYNLMLRSYLGARFHDAQCGFKAITASAARILLSEVQDNEWFFDTELLMLAQEHDLRLSEIPVHWVEDSQTTVNIPDTIVKDIAGMHRMHRSSTQSPAELAYRLSSRYSSLGWDSDGQHELRGSLVEVTTPRISS